MLSLDQVRNLEARVEKALGYIDELTEENASLRERLGGYEMRIKDLEVLVRDFQQDQGRIEEGILSALEKLNAFEDSRPRGSESEKAPERTAASAAPASPAKAPAPRTPSKKVEEEIEIDETDEIIEEEEESLPPSDEPKGAGELDIF
jgi:chromosome segregation ATPase